jgi:ribonucleotide monophosphatase NagD (HAD superfamily)
MLQAIMHQHGVSAQQTAMVGDRLYTDIRMARDAAATAILTLTGEARLADVELAPANERPDVVVADLDELSRLFRQNRAS